MSAAKGLYQAGKLAEAIAAVTAEVKSKPLDADCRGFLAELLCIDGQIDRADKQLDVILQQHTELAVTLALFRQMIRADEARRQVFGEGRVPEFLTQPPAHVQATLRAMVALRGGDVEAAVSALTEADEGRPVLSGTCDGNAFVDFRDLDDVTAGVMEVLTSTGKYYWIPLEQIRSIEFHAPERPRDLLWRRAAMEVIDGPDGEVFIPAIYPNSDSDAAKLGRITEWLEGPAVRGVGQRCFLVGEEEVPILQMTSVSLGNGD